MTRYTNPSGYVKYDTEKELTEQLEKFYFTRGFFDRPWKPQLEITKEVWISPTDRIDYYGIKNKKETYVEVKNWWVTKKDIQQILCYETKMEDNNFYVICGGIEQPRRNQLEHFDIKIILIKDIKEIDPEELCHWM